jgi:hypothetical protein
LKNSSLYMIAKLDSEKLVNSFWNNPIPEESFLQSRVWRPPALTLLKTPVYCLSIPSMAIYL